MNPTITRIRIYPIKSLDPVELDTVEIGENSLLHDREFAMLALDGRFVNGKRTGRVNTLQAGYDIPNYIVHFSERGAGNTKTFHLLEDKRKIESYLSGFFGLNISFLHNTKGRLLDIPDISCATVVSTASLQYLATEMKSHNIDDLRLRFRASLEISGTAPFWEERLALSSGLPVPFRIGNVQLEGNSLRARCNVPPNDPFSGEMDKTFVKKMLAVRERSIPGWSMVGELPSRYYLSVDCSIPISEKGKHISLGDELILL